MQDTLRVLKAGDTMTGDLSMNGGVVRGLPTTYPPVTYAGDEATSWIQSVKLMQDAITHIAEPKEPDNAATKNYVDLRKPLITVWAEENAVLNEGEYEWSFGNGGHGRGHSLAGYTMMAAGRILRMGLSVNNPRSPMVVNIVVNGAENTAYGVTKSAGQYSGTQVFTTPLELAQGNRINFRSATTLRGVTSANVSILIELDL